MSRTAKQESLLACENRRVIYEHLQKSPAAHLRQLERDLKMPLSTLEYHLYRLERGGIISSRQFNRYKSFFCTAEVSRTDKDRLYYLRQPRLRRLVQGMLGRGEASFQALARTTPIGASTISFHLRKLVDAGIVEAFRSGRSKVFRLTDPEGVRRLFAAYGDSWNVAAAPAFAGIAGTMTDVTAGPTAAPVATG